MIEQPFRVIYLSECLLPSDSGDYAAGIENLLQVSRACNGDHGITGALLFSTGYFAQVLEGAKPAIAAVLGRILCDPRHRNLRLIECGYVPARLFGNWSMAYTDGNEQFDLSIMDVVGMPSAAQGHTILRMLRHIVTPPAATAGLATGPFEVEHDPAMVECLPCAAVVAAAAE